MTIGTPVQAIIGLQPFCHAQKHRARTSNKSLTAAPFVSATYSWSCVPGVTAGSLTGARPSAGGYRGAVTHDYGAFQGSVRGSHVTWCSSLKLLSIAICSAPSEKSKTAAFSMIRWRFADFGTVTKPFQPRAH